jgi:nucleotide-binding universal stress UspA family protein
MFEKILVPLDGSELAKQVFGCVEDLTRAFKPTIVLAGVCEPHETEHEQACRTYISEEARRLQQNTPSSLSLQTTVLLGKPAELILEYAEKNDIGLIVISSHGRSGIRPWSLGSTANKVLHKVGVPLIMVRSTEPGAAPPPDGVFKKVLVPLDGSERGEAILPYVTEIHRRIPSEVVLFRVIERGTHVRSIGGLDYVRFEDRDIESTRAAALDYLKKAAAGLVEGVSFEVRVGDSAEEIINFAAESGCTLVAMTSHGHSGIESWLYGSVTYKVLQAGKEAVMLVPSGK